MLSFVFIPELALVALIVFYVGLLVILLWLMQKADALESDADILEERLDYAARRKRSVRRN